jgi:MFS family permease
MGDSASAGADGGRRTLREDLRALLSSPRELWLVFAATTLEYIGVFSFLIALPLWLTSDFGMSDERAGWWAATFSTLASLFVFMVGSIADVLGVRRTLVLSFGAAALLRAVMALAHGEWGALTCLLLFAFAYAASAPVLQVSVHRYSTKATRAIAFSLWHVALNVGGALAGVLVDAVRAPFLEPATQKLVVRSWVLPLFGTTPLSAYRAIMGLGALSAALAFGATAMLRTRVERGTADERAPGPLGRTNPLSVLAEVVRDPPFWRFMLLVGFVSILRMMFQHLQFTWPKYVTRELGEDFPWGTVWGLNSLLILGLSPLATFLTRHMRVLSVMIVGAFIAAAAPIVLVFGSSYPFQVAMIVTLTVGEALSMPRSYEYAVAIAPPGRESTYVSLSSLPFFLAKLIVGPTSGYLLAAFCPATGPRHSAALWAVICAITMVAPVGILTLRRIIEVTTAQKHSPAGAQPSSQGTNPFGQ